MSFGFMNKQVVIPSLVCAALLAVTAVFALNRTPQVKPPLTLRYVTTGLFTNRGYVYSGTVLWATNHTDRPYSVIQTHVDVHDGADWTCASTQEDEVLFHVVDASRTTRHLHPHEAGYATLQLYNRPVTSTWRLRFTVAEQLRGLASASARWRAFRALSALPSPYRPPIRRLNPWDESSEVSGRIVEVTTQEVRDQ